MACSAAGWRVSAQSGDAREDHHGSEWGPRGESCAVSLLEERVREL
jgi:hypothetical protein